MRASLSCIALRYRPLFSRFILNLPDEELASVERVCFQMEQAYAHSTDRACPVSLTLSLP